MNVNEFKAAWEKTNKQYGYNEPYPKFVEEIGFQIKKFMIPENQKYQGATGNARGMLDALLTYCKKTSVPEKNLEQFLTNINIIIDFLLTVRLTSQVPLNTAFFIRKRLEKFTIATVSEAKSILEKEIIFHQENYDASEDKIASIFKNRIIDRVESYELDKLIIGTHCHSGVVRKAIIEARDYISQVIVDKTEPEQQGVLTAYQLIQEGIPVKLINLSQFGFEFRKINLFMFGIDAVSADGVVLNKMGTRMIATLAKTKDLPVYFLGATYKYARNTLLGGLVKVERRKVEEKILFNHLGIDLESNLDKKVENNGTSRRLLETGFSAFDTTKPDFYSSVVSEVGFLPMREAFELAWKEYLD
ncbi:MAG: putative S-methyl-5-thioribose-1-phosphate isomerase [Promethearchaeota archaeon]|nr:MAG: putative S-methyl-5-thioribose-1-phosphate isomerase [Candidatus Lokiarchaeota archaeon]